MNKKELLELKEMINQLLKLGEEETSTKINRILKITKYSLILTSLIGIITCIICDISMNQKISWSLIVMISTLFANALIIPILTQKPKRINKIKYTLSITIIPYLLLLSIILENKLVFTLGSSISIISLAIIWIIHYIGKKYLKTRKYLFMGITFILLTILKILIHLLTCIFIENIEQNNIVNNIETIGIIAISIICFIKTFTIENKNSF